MLEQHCIYHKGQFITNFCRTASCSMPLCIECVSDHYQLHYNSKERPQIETISQTYQDVLKIVRSLYSIFGDNYQNLKNFYEYRGSLKTLSQQVGEFKQKFQEMTNQFFDNLQAEVEILSQNESNHMEQQLQTVEQFIKEKNNELDNMARKIDGPKGVKYMIQILTSNFVQTSKKDSEKCNQFIQSLSSQQLQLVPNDSKLYDLNIELAQLISIENKNFYQNYNAEVFTSDNKKDIHPLSRFADMKSPYQYSQNQSAPMDQSFLAKVQQGKNIPYTIKINTPLSQSSMSYHSFPEHQQFPQNLNNRSQNASQFLQENQLGQLQTNSEFQSKTMKNNNTQAQSEQQDQKLLYQQYKQQEIEKYYQTHPHPSSQHSSFLVGNEENKQNNNQISSSQIKLYPPQNLSLQSQQGYVLFPNQQMKDDSRVLNQNNQVQYTFQNNSTKYHHNN